MSKIMDWLENKFAPAMSKITQNPGCPPFPAR